MTYVAIQQLAVGDTVTGEGVIVSIRRLSGGFRLVTFDDNHTRLYVQTKHVTKT